MKVLISSLIFAVAALLCSVPETRAETQTVCAGSVPPGWIKIDDRWDPTKCGNPVAVTYNVWTIERYDNKPTGSVMTVCADVVPSGWSLIEQKWDPMKCGKPAMTLNNTMTIKRLNQEPHRKRVTQEPIVIVDNPKVITFVSLAVTPADSNILCGDTLQLRAIGTDANGQSYDVTDSASWQSSDETVASVSNARGSAGTVAANASGVAVISAIKSGITGTTSLTVLRGQIETR